MKTPPSFPCRAGIFAEFQRLAAHNQGLRRAGKVSDSMNEHKVCRKLVLTLQSSGPRATESWAGVDGSGWKAQNYCKGSTIPL